jgi:hypothetical protein
MNGKKILAAAALAGVLIAAPAALATAATGTISVTTDGSTKKDDLWLHIRVHEAQGDGEKTTVNLPLSLVQGFLAMVPDSVHGSGRIQVNGSELTVPQLRALWRNVRNQPEATWLTADADGSKVRVAKRAGYLFIRAAEPRPGDDAEVRIPVSVVDALLSGKGNEFELGAAISALARQGEGELVAVTSDKDTVRIWVDDESAGR